MGVGLGGGPVELEEERGPLGVLRPAEGVAVPDRVLVEEFLKETNLGMKGPEGRPRHETASPLHSPKFIFDFNVT